MTDSGQDSDDWAGFPEDESFCGDYYFDGYTRIDVHEDMLKDSVRTDDNLGSYRTAILQNKHLFYNKIVLDVGCGTGILSLFAAEAGAKHVYAVDKSSIIFKAEKIAFDNKMADRITFLRERIEDVKLPEKVDIIVSEWIGYFCLYESMLDSVVYARDTWLKVGGLIFPDKAIIYIAGIEDGEFKAEKIDSWRNFYNYDFSALIPSVLQDPMIEAVESKAVITNSPSILKIDLYKWKPQDSNFTADFKLISTKKDFLHAFVSWFDIMFTECHVPVVISTSPHSPSTHWKQTVFYIKDNIPVEKGDVITGTLSVRKNKHNERDLDIKLSYYGKGKGYNVEDSSFYRLRS